MAAVIRILGEEFRLECSAGDQRRLEDLAKALEVRLAGVGGEKTELRKLILVALSLMDEAQSTSAALMRARGEIERLNDMIAEERMEAAESAAPKPEEGHFGSLGAAVT